MSECVTTTVYFARPGPENTERVLEIARRRAEELGIRSILVATTTGATGVKVARAFPGYRVIAVTHVTGFKEPNRQELDPAHRQEMEQLGVRILTATHALGGAGRAIRKKLGTYQVDEVIAYTLRLFGEGTKVAAEIALMAADAGLVRTDEEVISLAGTGRGADTALVLRPANTHTLLDLRVLEILCKPRL
ncbi:MAG: pyruvate kinase alpha/beta domain-containing protein [Chloroflexia bacterium]